MTKTKKDLARMIKADMPELTIPTIELVLETAFQKIISSVVAGDCFSFRGFAVIEPGLRAAHIGVDPNNPMQKIDVPDVRTIKFKPSRVWKELMNNR